MLEFHAKVTKHSQKSSAFPTRLNKPTWLKRTRFLEVKDRQYRERRDHLQDAFGFIPFHDISQYNLHGLSQQGSGFDIVFVSTDDILGLRSIFAAPTNIILKEKLSFVISSRTAPIERAKFLRMGFDDVFSCDMQIDEILARVCAIHERRAIYDSLRDDPCSPEFLRFYREEDVPASFSRCTDHEQHTLHDPVIEKYDKLPLAIRGRIILGTTALLWAMILGVVWLAVW
jgi:hypothetical protein